MTRRHSTLPPDIWRDVVDAIGQVVVVRDPETGGVLAVSGSVQDMFGYTPSEYEEVSIEETVADPGFTAADSQAALERAIEEKETELEVMCRRADGDTFPAHVILLRSTLGDREVVINIVRDVTQERRREEELERFASVVSHDLQDPLNAANATLSLLKRETDSEYVDDLQGIVDRMAEIVDDVLTRTKQQEEIEETESVDLGDVVRDAWRSIESPEATLEVADGLGSVKANRGRLRTLFQNLLANAVTHGGPDVTVRVADHPEGFVVADDGPGIPETHRAEVFEGGYTTSEEGTGLGLDIVRRVAEAHNWSVDVEDSDLGGAAFLVRTAPAESGST